MMLAVLRSLLARSAKIRLASTVEEYRAIAAFRYEVYFAEQNERERADLDHEHREIWNEEDTAPRVQNWYVGEPGDVQGAVRVRVWMPGEVPRESWAEYEMDRLAGLDRRWTCEKSFLIFRPSLRGMAAAAAFTAQVVARVVEQYGVEAVFASCSAGHLRAYRRLGMCSYGARPRSSPAGVLLPIVGFPGDLAHLEAIHAPAHPALERLARRGLLPDAELASRTRHLRDDDCVVGEPERVAEALLRARASEGWLFLKALSESLVRRLAQEAILLNVPPGVDVVREGFADQEMFIVLAGAFDVVVGRVRLCTIGAGYLFGEMAFLQGPRGRRSATVTSVEQSRIVVLPRKLLARLRHEGLDVACDVYRAIALDCSSRAVAVTEPPPALRTATRSVGLHR
jgi:CRP-like cAMP-binding protein